MSFGRICLLIAVVFLLLGLVVLGCGVWDFVETRGFLASAVHGEGRLVKSERVIGKGVWLTVMVAREDELDLEVKVRDRSLFGVSSSEGRVPIAYLATTPPSARLNVFLSLYGDAIKASVFGGVFTLVGSLLLWIAVRTGTRTPSGAGPGA